ncbi:hypothetical protein N7645_15070 [Pseudomonas juntendi]|uniref:hypothetical protein n=1 Tax=Pseudomonas TaxID=286 RepID=UPI0012AE9A2F|nr:MULTISPECIES: hypothetical protein [Pseudomonas]MDG9918209.1 hypothetical protein [Pseudomonas juntendi]MDH0507657.1 hypothetical protein [Pseudomonas juntendi]MDH1044861.1 hypothetical protein [Pseudomonas juntendi]MRT62326.1 hypothetical protein [Pseudomonas sp. CAH-1]
MEKLAVLSALAAFADCFETAPDPSEPVMPYEQVQVLSQRNFDLRYALKQYNHSNQSGSYPNFFVSDQSEYDGLTADQLSTALRIAQRYNRKHLFKLVEISGMPTLCFSSSARIVANLIEERLGVIQRNLDVHALVTDDLVFELPQGFAVYRSGLQRERLLMLGERARTMMGVAQ